MKPTLLLFVLFVCFSLAACRKSKTDVKGLPPATQEGRNTLGFLLNGEPWTPQGFNGTANLSLYYDPTFSGGVFNIAAYKISNTSPHKIQQITLFGDSIQSPQKIKLPNRSKFGFTFYDEETSCNYSTFNTNLTIVKGYFDIQKVDKANRVFSGAFEIHFNMSGCRDIQLTQGRFDLKF